MKRAISILVSLTILVLIYLKIDTRELGRIFLESHPGWMAVSLGMVIPLTLMTAWRLQLLMPYGVKFGFGTSNKLILVASVLNLVLPSKMGDLAKAWFMRDQGLSGSRALSLVIFEKACDMLSLLLWCVFGLMLYPSKDWLFWVMTAGVSSGLILGTLMIGSRSFAQFFFQMARRFAPGKIGKKVAKFQGSWDEMHASFWGQRKRLLLVTSSSVFIWFLHLLQIWLFILALRAWCPFLTNLALSPLAILAGLLPLTFAGVGTRDAALVLFYAPYFSEATAAALGLLCTARYILPAIGGMPFAAEAFRKAAQMKKEGGVKSLQSQDEPDQKVN